MAPNAGHRPPGSRSEGFAMPSAPGGRRRARALVAAIVSLGVASACASPQPSATSGAGASLQPNPNAPSYALRDARAPARLPGTVHTVDLAVAELNMTVAEGFVQHVWAIAGPAQPLGWGTVPGPVIRVGTGDTLRVHLVNAPPPGTFPKAHPAVNDYSHAIEFDGSTGAHAEQTTPLRRAEERTFEVTTDRPGVWLYHGSTEPVLQSLANGLYGMLIVEPVGGLDSVAQELFFVQGEWYLESAFPASPRLPSLAKAGAAVSAPDFVVVNGAADQYLDNPIRIETGQRVRAFVLNAGPNLDMSFRVEGAVLDRVIRDGADVTAGPVGGWAADAVKLAPGQGAIVEFTIAEDGLHPFLTAADAAARGASGAFEAGRGGG